MEATPSSNEWLVCIAASLRQDKPKGGNNKWGGCNEGLMRMGGCTVRAVSEMPRPCAEETAQAQRIPPFCKE